MTDRPLPATQEMRAARRLQANQTAQPRGLRGLIRGITRR